MAMTPLLPGASDRVSCCNGVMTSSPCLPSWALALAAMASKATSRALFAVEMNRTSGSFFLVVSGNRHLAEADRKTVPGVDGVDGQSQVDQLRIAELGAYQRVVFVRCTGLGDQGQRFAPGQGCAFTFSEERCFAPDRHGVEAAFSFAGLAGIGGVHVDAEGAAVDQRDTQADQFQQGSFEAEFADHVFESNHALQDFRGSFVEIDALFHGNAP